MRRATTLVEVVIAATLVLALLAPVTVLAVQAARTDRRVAETCDREREAIRILERFASELRHGRGLCLLTIPGASAPLLAIGRTDMSVMSYRVSADGELSLLVFSSSGRPLAPPEPIGRQVSALSLSPRGRAILLTLAMAGDTGDPYTTVVLPRGMVTRKDGGSVLVVVLVILCAGLVLALGAHLRATTATREAAHMIDRMSAGYLAESALSLALARVGRGEATGVARFELLAGQGAVWFAPSPTGTRVLAWGGTHGARRLLAATLSVRDSPLGPIALPPQGRPAVPAMSPAPHPANPGPLRLMIHDVVEIAPDELRLDLASTTLAPGDVLALVRPLTGAALARRAATAVERLGR